MKVKVLSVVPCDFNGTKMFRVFALAPDGSVGNFYTTVELKQGVDVELTVSVNKDCKFVVRPNIHK